MPRADAQRNVDALLDAARDEFTENGVDVSVRAIASRAGVGTATLYRHYPQRSDLIVAVFTHELDACVAEAETLAAEYPPEEALLRWVQRYRDFLQTKRGLASALHSGDPAYAALPEYFHSHAAPALDALLSAAVATGAIRDDIRSLDILGAVANLCTPFPGSDPETASRLVGLLMDGLRRIPGPASA